MECPHMPQKREQIDEDPAVQALQKHACLIADKGKAQAVEEWAEDNACIGRLVSTDCPSTFRAATGTPPRQYTIQWQKSCD